MIRKTAILCIALIVLLGSFSCAKGATESSSHQMTGIEVFKIVSVYIPENVQTNGYFNWFAYSGSIMTLVFDVRSPMTLEELGWVEGPGLEIENTGLLPYGTFTELSFKVNGFFGEVLTRKASDDKLPVPPPIEVIIGPSPPPTSSITYIITILGATILFGTIDFLFWRIKRRKLDVPNHSG